MALWLVVGFILVSATTVMVLTFGLLRTAANVRALRVIAAVQYLAAAVLAGARLTGQA